MAETTSDHNNNLKREKRTWDESYAELLMYKISNGDCLVTFRNKEDPQLGAWVHQQRKDRHKLTEEQLSALDALGFVWNPKDSQWEAMFEKLRVHACIHGTVEVKNKQSNRQLMAWTHLQRSNHKQGHLSEDRKAKLDSLGFHWESTTRSQVTTVNTSSRTNQKAEERWKEQYLNLCEYRRVEGHCNVPFEYKEKSLGRWVSNQRETHAKNQLPLARKEKLDELNFIWNVKEHNREKAWKEMYDSLKEYYEENGDLTVPRKGYAKLRRWMATQCDAYANSTLSDEHEHMLEDLGFSFEDHATTAKQRTSKNKKKVVSPEAAVANPVSSPSDDSLDYTERPLALFCRLRDLILRLKSLESRSERYLLQDCKSLLEKSLEMACVASDGATQQQLLQPHSVDNVTWLLSLALELDKVLGSDVKSNATRIYCEMYFQHLIKSSGGSVVDVRTKGFVSPSWPAPKKRKIHE